MIRLHQFKKVELVTVCSQEKSEEEHLYMLQGIEEVMQKLGLHYRVMVLSSGDIGFSSSLTYDVEVWLPGQGRYREISSCSNCRDFQARRMMGRYYETDIEPSKNGNKKKYKYLHTLNGSGIAVGRALVAIMENYQDEDGNIKIPEVLFPYCNGIVKIMKNSQNLFH